MQQKLFDKIFEIASTIKDRLDFTKINPLCFIMACLEFSKTPYTGSDDFQNASSIRLEEEQLRLLVSELYDNRSILPFRRLALKSKEEMDSVSIEDYFEQAKALAKEVDDSYTLLRADIMLLLAVKSFTTEQASIFTEKFASLDFDIVESINSNYSRVDEYTIELIKNLTSELNKKLNKTIWYRDNYPARKVAEPDEIADTLANAYIIEKDGNILNVTFPYFFADENGELKLTVKKNGNYYYIHDNGYTNARLGIENEPLCFILFQDDLMVYFDYLLRYLNGFELEEGEHFADASVVLSVEATDDPSAVLERMRPEVHYDKEKGIYVYPHQFYFEHATDLSILLSVDKDGVLTISDGRAGKLEGEVLGYGYSKDWFEDIREIVEKVCNTYGAEIKNERLYVRCDDKNDYIRAIAKFLRAAIIIAHYGEGE